ncbi:MAG: protein kinase [Deltaproteobacteria bacterium]|nr:protein kinase [Deltaproteobacteria bacterium]
MNCPSCNTPLEPNARFCGVCGYRLQAKQAAAPNGPTAGAAARPAAAGATRTATPVGGAPQLAKAQPGSAPKPGPQRLIPKGRPKGDEIYINQVLNNRFRVESKIGEGGFGAVYRGLQLATGRKVALKLLHPEMTKDDNLVARFRQEGRVLCNLRDAHTITTYDFDQTPDGTLYIAMELLEGKSLHQLFHDQAPLAWKRMFKILTEMCSSLAEAHAQGIVHRDLKPENVYLETRPGNPEFVKILDFGIAKVMRGDTIDPQSPQLTATGQTLGTLEYMSPEQLMGKPLDGRSDVYALGVVAYEMITGRLPFPDAKGPAGLITAQLKQTPIPPSQANAKVSLPPTADRVILKCLEKDKANRYADVTALAAALSEVLAEAADVFAAQKSSPAHQRLAPPEMLETRRGDPPAMQPPAMPTPLPQAPQHHTPNSSGLSGPSGHGQQLHSGDNARNFPRAPTPPHESGGMPPQQSFPQMPSNMQGSSPNHHPLHYQNPPFNPKAASQTGLVNKSSSKKWVWWVVALLVLGASAGALLAMYI